MLSFLSTAVNIAIIWSGTNITIPLNDSLEPYKAIPEATLYIDDKAVEDPEMYYEYEVNHTRFSVVRTSAVGTYTIGYRAYFPTYGMSSTEMIKFIVVENEKPFLSVDDITINVGSKVPDLISYVTYYDNYDDVSELKLSIDSSLINPNIVGSYPVRYKVVDKSKNESELIKNVNVVDKIAPTIQSIKPIELEFKSKFNYHDYFKITDNYDQVLNITFDDKYVNYQKPGIYELTVIAKDQSLNTSSKIVNVSIIDNSKPNLRLKYNEITINYLQKLTIEELRSYIIDVSDNLSELNEHHVDITSYVDSERLGTYEVIYEVFDEVGTSTKEILKVHVKDRIKPKLTIIKSLTLSLNDLEPYILDYILPSDNYDDALDINVTTSGKIDMSKVGQYRLLVTLKDTSKNEITYPLVFSVKDLISPTIKQSNEIVITDFLKPNLETYFIISDNYDKNINIDFDDTKVDYQTPGIYDLIVTIFDQSRNENKLVTEVKVLDTSAPELILTNKEIFVSFDQTYNLLDYVDQINDNYDKNLTLDNIVITSNIIDGVIGRYNVTYTISDSSLNKISENLTFIIGDYVAPVIKVDYIEINKDDNFDYKKYAKALDNYDGDITDQISFSPNYIPTSIPGTYEAIFYVHDSAGNYAEQKVVITVRDTPKQQDYVIYVSVGVVIAIICGTYYFVSKRKVKF